MATEGIPSANELVRSVEPGSRAIRVFKYCRHCRCRQRFRCLYKFRVNANRKLVDVWLLFNCARCSDTAKLPVLERVPVSRIGRSDLKAYEANDRQWAAAAASDRTLLKRAGFSVEDRPGRRELPRDDCGTVPGGGRLQH